MKLVCIGDSLTYGYGVESEKSWINLLSKSVDFQVINAGIPGNRVSEMLARFEIDVLRHNPSHMLLMGGTNDMMLSFPIQGTFEGLMQLLKLAKERHITPILMLPISVNALLIEKTWFVDRDYYDVNKNLEEISQEMKTYCQKQNIKIIDLYHFQTVEAWQSAYIADGIHINETGHRMIFEIIHESLKYEGDK